MQTPTLSYLIEHTPIYVKELASRSLTPRVKIVTNKGLRVATEKIQSDIATVGVWLNAGSRNEKSSQLGASFFLQNALLNPLRNTKVKEFKARTGAKFGSQTGRDQSSFYVRVLKEHAAEAVQVLKEAIETPVSSSEFAAISPLASASRKKLNTQNRQVDQTAHEAAFHGCNLENDPLGPEEVHIDSIAVNDFLKENYFAQRAVVVGVGDIDESAIQKKAEGLLKEREGYTDLPHHVVYNPCEQKVWNEHLTQPSIGLLYRTPGIAHPDYWVLRVWQALFGSWIKERGYATGSNLMREVALNHLATSVDAVLYAYPEISLWGLKGDAFDCTEGHDSHSSEQLLWKFIYEINRACKATSQDDALRAKYLLRSQIIEENTGVQNTANRIGSEVLNFGNRLDPLITLDRIDSITSGDIRRVGEEWFYHCDPVYVGVGPMAQTPNYNAIRRLTYWWRD